MWPYSKCLAAATDILFNRTSAPSTDIALVLFDSQLDNLKLPVLKHPPAAGNKKASKLEHVAFFVQKYFELVAVFEEGLFHFVVDLKLELHRHTDDMFLNSSQEDENEALDRQRRNRMQIFRHNQNEAFETHRWVERPDVNSGSIHFCLGGLDLEK